MEFVNILIVTMGVIIGIMLGAVVGFIGIGAIVRIVLKFLGKSKQKINKRWGIIWFTMIVFGINLER